MIRILLVDDQNLVQQGIKSLLDRNSEFKVIGTVTDGRIAVKHIDTFRPDIVLLDIEMPGMDGITATKYISRMSPKTKVIILSSHEDKKYVTQALMAGAKGYILKSSLMTDLKQSIIAVNNGYSQIESRLLAKVFDPSNIRSRKKSRVKSRKDNNSDAIETIAEPKKPKSVVPQTKANRVNQSDFVVLSKPNLTTKSHSIKSNKAELANLKPVTVDARINLIKSVPLIEEDTQLDHASSSEVDNVAKLSNTNVTSINVVNPLLPVAIAKRSTTEISSSTEENMWNKLSELVVSKTSRIHLRASQLRLAQLSSQAFHFYQLIAARSKPTFQSYRTKFTKSWYRVSPVIERWYQQGWLANAALILLGIVVVLMIHLIFF